MDLIILFFALGIFAAAVKSDLEFPEPIAKFLSIYLLISLGLKGGHEVSHASSLVGFFPAFLLGIGTCLLIPIYMFFFTKKRLGPSNAAAISACYGSISAIAFIAVQNELINYQIQTSGYMIAIMALMEIPAIILSFYLLKQFHPEFMSGNLKQRYSILTAKSVFLLLGGFIIGLTISTKSWNHIKPLFFDLFNGFLALFILDIGIQAQKQIKSLLQNKLLAIIIALAFPLLNGTLTLFVAKFLNLQMGDQILLAILAGSASNIAAPAAIKNTLHGANPSLYVTLPLAMTLPLNLFFGVNYYIWLSRLIN